MKKIILYGIILYNPLAGAAISDNATPAAGVNEQACMAPASPPSPEYASALTAVTTVRPGWQAALQKPWTSIVSAVDAPWSQAIREGRIPPGMSAAAAHAACVASVASSVASLGWTSALTVPYRALTMTPIPDETETTTAMRLLRMSAGGLLGAATLNCMENLYRSLANKVAQQRHHQRNPDEDEGAITQLPAALEINTSAAGYRV